MSKVGIIVNLAKDIDLKMTTSIIDWLEKNKCTVFISEIVASKIQRPELGYAAEDIYKLSDFIIVLGGDGTLLGAAREVLWFKTPILGVNMGHLGFIAEVEAKDVFVALEKILKGQYSIEDRTMLEAKVIKDGMDADTFYCLNDIGITRGTLSRIITLKVYLNGSYMDTYNADGIVVSTPTGSTAYSLSAGGPIVNPRVSAILITPISPHSLNSRSIVISKEEIVRIDIVDNYQEVYLTVDGQQGYKIKSGDSVIIREAPFGTKLIKVTERSFYDVLRTKLKE